MTENESSTEDRDASEAQRKRDADTLARQRAGTRYPGAGRRKARKAQRKAQHAQVVAARALARAADLGVDPLPILPSGSRASTRAYLEARLAQNNGVLSLALADRLIREALDEEASRSLDAARITLEQTEDARVKRTETTQRSARIVLNIDQPQGDGGTLELGSGPIQDGTSSSSSPLPLSPPPSPPLSLPPPLPLPSPALSLPAPLSVDDVNVHSPSAAAAPDSLAERVAKLEASQEEMLSLLRSLASRIVGG